MNLVVKCRLNIFVLSPQAVQLLKENGTLVYSTCTITTEENEQMVAWALDSFPCLQLAPQVSETVIILLSPRYRHQPWVRFSCELCQRSVANARAPHDQSWLGRAHACVRTSLSLFDQLSHGFITATARATHRRATLKLGIFSFFFPGNCFISVEITPLDFHLFVDFQWRNSFRKFGSSCDFIK